MPGQLAYLDYANDELVNARPNTNIKVLNAVALTTTQTSQDYDNPNCRGIAVALVTSAIGTGSITLEIDVKDAFGNYNALLTGAAVITNTTNIYRIYPGLTAVANATASDVLWRTWRIKVTANNANAATYTVSAHLLQ